MSLFRPPKADRGKDKERGLLTHPVSRGIRVVVTGGRHYNDKDFVDHALAHLHATFGIAKLADGKCYLGGADDLGYLWAVTHGVPTTRYPVDPGRDGAPWAGGGPRRNERMLLAEQPHLVVAFPGGSGTARCKQSARRFGFPVWETAIGWNPETHAWGPEASAKFPLNDLLQKLGR